MGNKPEDVMEPFRTVVNIRESVQKLDYGTFSLWMGSCFTENIGSRLRDLKFPAEVNPFGVLYNPVSIKNSLEFLIRERRFTESDLHHGNGLWYSFYHHSSFSHADRDTCLKNINEGISRASGVLRKAGFLFITFGTARVYILKETPEIVSNCHKLPHGRFSNVLLDVNEIVDLYTSLINDLKGFNSGLRIVFTISPVRHWKDGATGNQVSKSTLMLAVSELVEAFGNVTYFPAYEIIMDDLRDYRFYEPDMLHINSQGTGYIWEKFAGCYISPGSEPVLREVGRIRQGLEHRPFNPLSPDYRDFLENLLERMKTIEQSYPMIDFSAEREAVVTGLKNFRRG